MIVIPFGEQLSDRHPHCAGLRATFAGRVRHLRRAGTARAMGAHQPRRPQRLAECTRPGSELEPQTFVRMVKAWSYFNDQPIWSYYLELCVADFFKNDAAILYSVDLNNFFNYLHARRLAAFDDAAGCSERCTARVSPAKSARRKPSPRPSSSPTMPGPVRPAARLLTRSTGGARCSTGGLRPGEPEAVCRAGTAQLIPPQVLARPANRAMVRGAARLHCKSRKLRSGGRQG